MYTDREAAFSFLHAGSDAGKFISSQDWSASGIGEVTQWPELLRSTLAVITRSGLPMLLLWGREMNCFYNDAFHQLLGAESFQIGKRGSEVWKDHWTPALSVFERILESGQSVVYEDQLMQRASHGLMEDFYSTGSYSAVVDEAGKPAAVLGVFSDTTEKVRLFHDLQESIRSYEFALAASEMGTWDINPRTGRFTANSRLKDWFGLDNDKEVLWEEAISVIAHSDRDRVGQLFNEALRFASGGAYAAEYTIIHPVTGQERVVRAKGKVFFNEEQVPVRFNGTLQDITAEAAAQAQNQKLSILVENSVDLMAILRMDGRNSYINAAGRQLLGIDKDADVTQIPITDFHTPEQYAFVSSEIIPNVLSRGTWSGAFAVKNGKTGEIIPLYNNCHRIDDERTGEPVGVGTVMRDMRPELNARTYLEEQVRERTRELTDLNRQLEQKNKDLTSFAFVSSHDLQEPLRKINTYISRIEENGLKGDYSRNDEFFERIKTSVSRMQRLISDLLLFSKTNISDELFEQVDLGQLLTEVAEEFKEGLTLSTAEIHADVLPVLSAVPFQVKQLFSNLFSNAIKFARPDLPLKLTISASTTDKIPGLLIDQRSFYCIAFADNGIGFDNEFSERIFDVFQRLHSKDAYEGTGVGLSICKRIMEHHRGHIRAKGDPGTGAVFYLYFPAA